MDSSMADTPQVDGQGVCERVRGGMRKLDDWSGPIIFTKNTRGSYGYFYYCKKTIKCSCNTHELQSKTP